MSFEYDLISAMREWDLHINSIDLTEGKYHRFRSIGVCKTKCCEYRIFENQLGAHFQCWRRGINRFWFANSDRKPTIAEQIQMQNERDRIARDRLVAYDKATAKCVRFFALAERSTKDPTQHPYPLRKRIYPHGARLVRGLLVLPIIDIDGDIISLQFIKRNGFKQFKSGAPVAGGMIWLGNRLPLDYKGVIRLCEGWSTGCTIYQITKLPVVCALNAHNMPIVAALLRKQYPDVILKICADDDQWGKQNTGLVAAVKADISANGFVYVPDFAGLDVSSKPTDFNDLYCLAGAAEVKRQLILIRKRT